MTFPKGRRGLLAGPSACLALLMLTGCVVGGDDAADVSDTPRRDFAGRPATTAPQASGAAASGASAEASAGASAAATTGATTAPRPSDVPAGTSAPAPGSSPAPPYRPVATLQDGSRDNGLGAPSYGDLRSITLEDDGTRARVTVHLSGALPARGASGEAIGIGVDFYRTATQQESDYQLFADGGPDGWFAYLHTPKGFVRYPGSFALTADGLSFTVPWSSLGAPSQARFSAFADWTQRRTTGNAAGNDRAPLAGSAAFRR